MTLIRPTSIHYSAYDTGCDTVSAFAGHGKIKAFKLMREHAHALQPIKSLRTTCDVANQTPVINLSALCIACIVHL